MYSLAEQPQHHADNDEHQCHARQNANHCRINVALGHARFRFTWVSKLRTRLETERMGFGNLAHTFALELAVFVDDGRHFEATDTTAISAFRLHVEFLALFIEEARFIEGGHYKEWKVEISIYKVEPVFARSKEVKPSCVYRISDVLSINNGISKSVYKLREPPHRMHNVDNTLRKDVGVFCCGLLSYSLQAKVVRTNTPETS